jgi:glycopeptide antibiotics resistance protein
MSLLVPAAFLVALMPFQKTTSTRRYLLLLSGSLLVAIAVGVVYAAVSHKAIADVTLVSCGLVFIALGWLQGPGSNHSRT